MTPNAGSAVPVGKIGVRIVHGLPEPAPAVRLVVATALAHADVESCITSLLRDTEYARLSLTLVVDERTTEDHASYATLERVTRDPRVDVVAYPHREFNYAWVQNWAVSRSGAETLCLVNDDVSVLEPRWLELMVGHLFQDRVGAVGARRHDRQPLFSTPA